MSDTKSEAAEASQVVISKQGDTMKLSPYTLFSSDNPGSMITSVHLKGDNYNEWSLEMLNALRAKKKSGFVDGSLPQPEEGDVNLESWLSVNSMIVGWIRTSIEPRVRSTVTFITNAHKLWENLKQRFAVGNKVRVHQLMEQLASCRQNGEPVIDYFGKLSIKWEEMQTYRPSPPCTCTAARIYEKEREDERVHQFIMGLDESRFGNVVSSIIEADELPDIGKVYAKVIREEARLDSAKTREHTQDVVGFATRRDTNTDDQSARRDSREGSVSQGGRADFSSGRARDRVCSHCGKTGHDKNTCWQLIGYPEWMTERGGGRGGRGSNRGGGRGFNSGRGRGITANIAHATTPHVSTVADLTPEQLKAITQIIQDKQSGSSEKLSGKVLGDIIIDTGASHHMTGNLSLLVNVRKTLPCSVGFADGSMTMSASLGEMVVSDRLSLKEVLYVPDLNCSLISVSKLLKHMNCFALFTDAICLLQDRSTKTMIGAGEERDGVYYFKDVKAALVNRTDGKVVDHLLWHRRLGHPAFSVLSVLPMCSGVLNKDSPGHCDVCFRAKQTRDPFPDSLNKAEVCFGLIHVDVWGPYRVPASSGAVYFLTIVDDFSRATWTYLLLAKSEVGKVLQNFCAYTERQFNKRVKEVRSDNGSEFMCLSSFFREKGIIHQTSCVATPQQNGRVERKHRHILNVARALLFQAGLPVKFWGEAISTATHLINLTPSKILHGLTPHEVLFGRKPSYEQLRVFGSSCYVHRNARDKDKFGARSRHCVFVGYPFGKKGWKVYDMERNEFFVSRDVVFQEDKFPMAESDMAQSIEQVSLEPFVEEEEGLITSVTRNRGSEVVEVPVGEESVVVTEPVEGDNSDKTTVSDEAALETATPVTETEETVPAVPEFGRGHREKQVPAKFNDYMLYNARMLQCPDPHHTLIAASTESSTVQGTPYPLDNFVTDMNFSPAHQAFLAAVTKETEPRNFREAVQHEIWRNSMQKEITAFEVNKTFSIVDLPPGKTAIGNMWIYKYKYNADGTIERPKSRLVALGNRQVEGEDYDETFAPVAKMTTIRGLLRVIAGKGWIVHQMDVHNAFLHGELHEEVYMKLPLGFHHSDPRKVCRLHKAIYGLKQAPRCWFAKLTNALKKYGFVHSYSDYSLFTYEKNNVELKVLIYVDDLIVCGNNMEFLTKFKDYLGRCFHMKDLGKLKYFLGIEVGRGKEGFMLTQRKYALDIIQEAGLLGAKPVATPMEQRHQLGRDKSAFLREAGKYRRLVGRLIYLSVTRTDITYSVHILSQFMQSPRENQWEAALRVVRYLKGTVGQGILLSSSSDFNISVYCDADWNSCPTSRRSVSSFVTLVGDSPISWKTEKQDFVSHSSAEAEYRSMSEATREIKWLVRLAKDLGFAPKGAVKLYCDSKSAMYIAANPVFHERTKHIESACHQVRDAMKAGLITAVHVRTNE